MGSLLVHITHGPEAPTRAALGFLVARAGVQAGHDVSVFLAGDAVQLVRKEVVETLRGLGTGALSETLPAVVEGGGQIYVSGMSAKARGVTEADLGTARAALAMPDKLVELTFASERVLTY